MQTMNRSRKVDRLVAVDVLIVEDQPELRSSLAELLDDADFAVAWAANGEEAMEMIDAGVRPRLVVLDMNMPVMGGAEFLRARADHKVLATVPVVVTSGEEQTEEVRGQVAACLEKPVDLRQLFNIIAAAKTGLRHS